MTSYDCTEDVKAHIEKVRYWMRDFANQITGRAKYHDQSKLKPPEKDVFDVWTPKLKEFEFGSDEYKAALQAMGEGLKHHYVHNRHHPEHFEQGINGMVLSDVVEMFCDWLAAAETKGEPVNLDYLCQRFGIESQLAQILLNTLAYTDFWNAVGGVPVIYFTPSDKSGLAVIE